MIAALRAVVRTQLAALRCALLHRHSTDDRTAVGMRIVHCDDGCPTRVLPLPYGAPRKLARDEANAILRGRR